MFWPRCHELWPECPCALLIGVPRALGLRFEQCQPFEIVATGLSLPGIGLGALASVVFNCTSRAAGRIKLQDLFHRLERARDVIGRLQLACTIDALIDGFVALPGRLPGLPRCAPGDGWGRGPKLTGRAIFGARFQSASSSVRECWTRVSTNRPRTMRSPGSASYARRNRMAACSRRPCTT